MKSIFLTFLFLMSVIQLSAQNLPATKADQLLEEVLEKGSAGITAACTIDGKEIWKGTGGFADIKEKIPFSSSTKTRLASIAKPMTAIAIMQLVEKNLLDLDVPIQTYVPEYPNHGSASMTTRMLLAHTSGIDGYKSGKEAQNKTAYSNLTEAMKVFMHRKLKFEPGTNYSYTSYGYVVLGVILERVSGLSFGAYMKQHIWQPAGMTDTEIEVSTPQYENKSLLYHSKNGKIRSVSANDLSNRIPGGGFHSTLEDLLKFGNAVLNQTLLGPAFFKEMTAVSFVHDEGNPYGLGWVLYGNAPDFGEVIGHDGGQTGANTLLLINPTKKIVVAVLSNTSGTGDEAPLLGVNLLWKCNEILEG